MMTIDGDWYTMNDYTVTENRLIYNSTELEEKQQ